MSRWRPERGASRGLTLGAEGPDARRRHFQRPSMPADSDAISRNGQETIPARSEIAAGQWNHSGIRGLLTRLLAQEESIDDYAVELPGPSGVRQISVNGRRIAGQHPGSIRLLLAIHLLNA